MKSLVRALTMACLGVSLMSFEAAAQAVADTLATWGRLGAWAVDCSRPPDGTNTHSLYLARTDRSAYYVRSYGDGKDTNEIETASIAADGLLVMTIAFPELKQRREVSFVRGPDGRIRAFHNRQVGGDYSVRDGNFVANGKPTPWQSKCD